MTMDDKYVEDIWKLLKNAFQVILEGDQTGSLNTEELYR